MRACARGHIEPGGFQGGMAQHIRKVCEVFFHRIKAARKQVPQVMREYLARVYPPAPRAPLRA